MTIISVSDYKKLSKADLEKKVRQPEKVHEVNLKHCGCRMLWEYTTFPNGVETKTYQCLKCDHRETL